jgi:hypothetical protein
MNNNAEELGKTVHLRALNHLRRDHPLTYVGARILVESATREALDDWTQSYILDRARTGRQQVYWQHSLFNCPFRYFMNVMRPG